MSLSDVTMDKSEVEGEDIPIPPYVCCVLTEGIWTIFLAGMLIINQKEERFFIPTDLLFLPTLSMGVKFNEFLTVNCALAQCHDEISLVQNL